MREFTLPEQAPVAGILDPATDAAGRTGRWVSCKNAHKVYLVAYINQGVATTVALTINQATSNAGAGSKVITGNCRIWTIADLTTTDSPVRQADGVNFTTDAGVKPKMVIFELDPATLDLANGFNYVTLITGASSASNITSAVAQEVPTRFSNAVPPSMFT